MMNRVNDAKSDDSFDRDENVGGSNDKDFYDHQNQPAPFVEFVGRAGGRPDYADNEG